jgi:hypothetical protein
VRPQEAHSPFHKNTALQRQHLALDQDTCFSLINLRREMPSTIVAYLIAIIDDHSRLTLLAEELTQPTDRRNFPSCLIFVDHCCINGENSFAVPKHKGYIPQIIFKQIYPVRYSFMRQVVVC